MNLLFKKIVYWLLKWEAALVIKKKKPQIIAVTGSVGKTSTKEAIWCLLKEHFDVAKSPKSYNSEVGVPLTVLGLESAWNSPIGWLRNLLQGAKRVFSRARYPEMLILEMGVDRPGDFDKILPWVSPDIGVVTAIGEVPVHVEFFPGPDGVAAEKSKMIAAVPADGCAIVNADDPRSLHMKDKTNARAITYGFGKSAMLRASHYKMHQRKGAPSGITFKIDYDGKTMPIHVDGVVGEQTVYALLAAAAVGIAVGLNLIEIGEGLAKYVPPPGRLRLIEGMRDTLVIDDSYNASPLAVEAALHVVSGIPAHRRIAVLGDMLELGKYTIDEHKKIGRIAEKMVDLVIAVGVRAKFLTEERKSEKFHWFPNSSQAAGFLKENIEPGDVILVKGSQGVRMEKVVEALMLEPEKAGQLLVRQEPYWKMR